MSSKPGSRRAYFSTSCGSNLPNRSRGTSRSIAPESVRTRLRLWPLRLWPSSRPASCSRCSSHLRVQRALGNRLLQIVDQRAAAEHLGRVLAGQQLVRTQILRPSNTEFLTGSAFLFLAWARASHSGMSLSCLTGTIARRCPLGTAANVLDSYALRAAAETNKRP